MSIPFDIPAQIVHVGRVSTGSVHEPPQGCKAVGYDTRLNISLVTLDSSSPTIFKSFCMSPVDREHAVEIMPVDFAKNMAVECIKAYITTTDRTKALTASVHSPNLSISTLHPQYHVPMAQWWFIPADQIFGDSPLVKGTFILKNLGNGNLLANSDGATPCPVMQSAFGPYDELDLWYPIGPENIRYFTAVTGQRTLANGTSPIRKNLNTPSTHQLTNRSYQKTHIIGDASGKEKPKYLSDVSFLLGGSPNRDKSIADDSTRAINTFAYLSPRSSSRLINSAENGNVASSDMELVVGDNYLNGKTTWRPNPRDQPLNRYEQIYSGQTFGVRKTDYNDYSAADSYKLPETMRAVLGEPMPMPHLVKPRPNNIDTAVPMAAGAAPPLDHDHQWFEKDVAVTQRTTMLPQFDEVDDIRGLLREKAKKDAPPFFGMSMEKTDTVINSLWDQGPAHLAGIQVGDQITSISGTKVKKYDDLLNQMKKCHVTIPVELTFIRNGNSEKATLIPKTTNNDYAKVDDIFYKTSDHFKFPEDASSK